MAFDLVPVLPANGADPFTILPAHALHRQQQENLFPHDIAQLETVAFIEADFQLGALDGGFTGLRSRGGRQL